MLIYLFAEHYPNPYTPYFDTQFAHFLKMGHEILIFAGGQFTSVIHDDVRRFSLDERTAYLPTTLKTMPAFISSLLWRWFRAPWLSARRGYAAWDRGRSWRENLMRAARAILLPLQGPDVCIVHNLVTAAYFDFLKECYPHSRVCMHWHGGEVGGVSRVNHEPKIFRRFDVVFTNTLFSRQQAIGRGCDPAQLVILPVGFDLEHYVPQADRRYRHQGITRFISVGRLSEEKGLEYAIDALAMVLAQGVRNWCYVIVGKGPALESLRARTVQHQLSDYIVFAGEQDRKGVLDLLAQADVLILPSIETETWAETQACVLQEAMLMRVPVITTTVGGVPESISASMRQFAVPPKDVFAIAEMVRRMLVLPEEEFSRLGDEGRQFVMARYDIDAINRQLLEGICSRGWPCSGHSSDGFVT